MDYIKVRDFLLQINFYSDASKMIELIYKREMENNLTRVVELLNENSMFGPNKVCVRLKMY